MATMVNDVAPLDPYLSNYVKMYALCVQTTSLSNAKRWIKQEMNGICTHSVEQVQKICIPELIILQWQVVYMLD